MGGHMGSLNQTHSFINPLEIFRKRDIRSDVVCFFSSFEARMPNAFAAAALKNFHI